MNDPRTGKLLNRYLYLTAASLGVAVLVSAFSGSPRSLYAWAVFAAPLCVLAIVQSMRFWLELSALALVAFVKWIVRRIWRIVRIGPEPFAPHVPPQPPPASLAQAKGRTSRRASHDHPVI